MLRATEFFLRLGVSLERVERGEERERLSSFWMLFGHEHVVSRVREAAAARAAAGPGHAVVAALLVDGATVSSPCEAPTTSLGTSPLRVWA